MTVKRIVANITVADIAPARDFYEGVLGLRLVMDHGWLQTFATDGSARPQVSIATEGGSGAPVPDLSVEVDDVDGVYAVVRARGIAVEYGPADEPWGVRRFFVRDPFGRLLNILEHAR